ncbi:YidH family protein [Nocardia veterana]|uniref:DUF202 domain-containing protein n=1 Tax=Nocardia veterana TaxID=132249 RepID=A0A7X6M015_9NOCA|nr:DUF202 domain-containing protein [Nocardia veterana]NKY87693.1 DUF202 domain-containing protein [Nocardia veterana]
MTDREPDYRFTLANERTLLAWVRTALALLAGGVAVGQLLAPEFSESARRALALTCITLAAVIAVGALLRWRCVQRAMRHDAPLPRTPLTSILVGGVVAAALICAVAGVG